MPEQGNSLEVIDLYKTFGEREVLKSVSFKVSPGVLMGFVGANGAGKTTTMRIIMGITKADKGQALFNDAPVDDTARTHIGYMPEERGLYPKMKVGEQLVYFARLHGLSKPQAAKAAHYWMDCLGVREREKDVLEKLSLGNQQRVQLAAALASNPQALILDEPFSGLDPLAVDIMSGVLREYAERGVPVIFSSHQLGLVEDLCTHVAIISKGTIVATGEVESLRTELSTPAVRLRGSADALGAGADKARELERTVHNFKNELVVDVASDSAAANQILVTALGAGTVSDFSPVTKSLAEIFRAVVEPEVSDESEVKSGDAANLEGEEKQQ
ncbi:ABC transporter ATP-binding protein [Mobiluncus mulieris]|uniref:ABC transporter ATP-binding protein n=1 Tax=Mobiluncus mulieris TaxID=2052 RepID=A0A848RPH2_9ACTO|nr:ATP-binding cassette domain-containing protein [Mobiluncus mulieris]NMW93863.1 ABC transporter ATP-binding protein [Mobiluncus mulieris]